MAEPLLSIEGLRTRFDTSHGPFLAVDGVSLSLGAGETLAVLGESGCGKSATALSVMRLIPDPPGRVVGGAIHLEGEDLLTKSEAEMRAIRGNRIAMIYQEPMSALNPVFSIGSQIADAIRQHRGLSRRAAFEEAVAMLKLVGIPLPERRVNDFPHQFSGGMRQRAMIAMALSCNPKLLIADEPTTALDVTVQAQILRLLDGLRKRLGMAILLITHDLGVVAEMCERVVVMYAGKVVEQADARSLFANPLHPYTEGLLASIPRMDGAHERLFAIPGSVPAPHEMPAGCRFAPRCSYAFDRCQREEPVLETIAPGRAAACFLAGERLAG